MIKGEIYKLFKIKALLISLFLVIGTIIYSMMVYGGFGYNLSRLLTIYSNTGLIAYSEENGELLSGQKGYERNKEVATRYAGEVNDSFLEQLHLDFNTSSYVEFGKDERFFNATYSFFQDVFNIGSKDYAMRDEVWGDVDGPIRYGFTGDWDAYGNILQNFFLSFSIFAIVFTAPLFTYDRECNMTEFLGTAENGGRQLFKYKVKTAFFAVNFLMITLLIIISLIHFLQYGFANADVNIQCSFEQRFVGAAINCTMGQLTIWRLLFGIIGCNMILLLTMLISMLSQTTLTTFAISTATTWLFSYPIVNMLGSGYILNLLLSIIPVNALYINVLLLEVSTWYALCGIFVGRVVLFVMLFFITAMIWRKFYFTLNRQGD